MFLNLTVRKLNFSFYYISNCAAFELIKKKTPIIVPHSNKNIKRKKHPNAWKASSIFQKHISKALCHSHTFKTTYSYIKFYSSPILITLFYIQIHKLRLSTNIFFSILHSFRQRTFCFQRSIYQTSTRNIIQSTSVPVCVFRG